MTIMEGNNFFFFLTNYTEFFNETIQLFLDLVLNQNVDSQSQNLTIDDAEEENLNNLIQKERDDANYKPTHEEIF